MSTSLNPNLSAKTAALALVPLGVLLNLGIGIIYKDSCFNEHTVAELNDGRLWMLSRGMKETFQSFSADGGNTW